LYSNFNLSFNYRSSVASFISFVLPFAVLFFIFRRAGGASKSGGGGLGGGLFGGMSQSKARVIKENTGVTFKYNFKSTSYYC
jgi:hypothetical protein